MRVDVLGVGFDNVTLADLMKNAPAANAGQQGDAGGAMQ